MKTLNEQEIQQMVEARFAEKSKDQQPHPAPKVEAELRQYEQLFTALASPPTEGLRMDFSAKLRHNLQQQLQKQNRIRFYSLWALLFIIVMTSLYLALMLIDKTYQTNITTTIIAHKWIFILGFFCLFLIQYLDHRTVKMQQWRKNYPQKNN